MARPMERFGLHGSLLATPGQRDALVTHMLEAARLMQDAPGCELYLVSTSETDDDDAVWITEIWRTEADHDASLSLPGVPELIGRARPLIAEMGDSQRLRVLGEGRPG
ncbi:MAG: antibiotic biosynthesis monooxygenase [Chloroflexota bacterium]|nr:antibiotic biosynthesis monooxygenase [Chloroflexota bacterium]